MTDPATIHQQDQADAAAGHALAWVVQLAGPLDATVHRAIGPSDWTRRLMDRFNREIVSGRAYGCRHLNGGLQPVFVAAWAPAVHMCAECASSNGVWAQTLTPVESNTCDECRRHLPDQIKIAVIQNGRYLLHIGLCRQCRQDSGLPVPRPSP